jgi:hypothetical protein
MTIALSKNRIGSNHPQLTLDDYDYFIFCSLKVDHDQVICPELTLITRLSIVDCQHSGSRMKYCSSNHQIMLAEKEYLHCYTTASYCQEELKSKSQFGSV